VKEDDVAFTVLVGFDGKPPSRAALDVALGLAARAGGHVIIAHLVDGPSDPHGRAHRHIEGQSLAKGALLAAGNRSVSAEAIVADRPVVEGLVRLAAERGADLLVVGDSRDSALAGALTGSVCHALVHRTTLPVVMVPVAEESAAKAA
jgi:nucleotide-binding universal stress UspA family protein